MPVGGAEEKIGDVAILLAAGYSRRDALILNIVSGGSGILGALAAYGAVRLVPTIRPFVLAFSSASLLYIAMSDLIPDLHRGQVDSDSLRPPDPTSWVRQRLAANKRHHTAVIDRPAEFADVGTLRRGEWEPDRPGYDNRSTWRTDGETLHFRLPWSMLGIGDPSSTTAVVPRNGRPAAVPVTRIAMLTDLGAEPIATGAIQWAGWQRVEATERVKRGVQPLVDAYVDTSR